MDHFPIIQTLCRIGLGDGNPAFRRQVERLRDALRKQGDTSPADTLNKILEAQGKAAEMQPSRLVRSLALEPTERLTPRVAPPVDRDTSTPLAEIKFPQDPPKAFPVLNSALANALESLIDEWKNIYALERLEVEPARTCLFYGLPGTGKTRMAYALADRLGLPVVVARLDGLVGSFLGTTSRNIANLFEFANRYGCLLLLDEFDAIAKLRDDPQEMGEIKRVVNTLLQNLDARAGRGFTVAITNHERLLDPAVWRRFEVRIQVPPPDLPSRREIIRQYLMPLEFSPASRQQAVETFLAWFSEGLTGADIETMIRSIKRHIVLHPESDPLTAMRSYILTHAGNAEVARGDLVLGNERKLALTLVRSHGFTQGSVAELFKVKQPSIARWVKEAEAEE